MNTLCICKGNALNMNQLLIGQELFKRISNEHLPHKSSNNFIKFESINNDIFITIIKVLENQQIY